MRSIRYLSALTAAVGLLTACSDDSSPTLPAMISRASTLGEQAGRPAMFTCITHVASPGDRSTWRANVRRLRFPASELAPNGQTIAYRYRGYTPDNRIVATADCQIPATEEAIRRMNRRFEVSASHRIARQSDSAPRRPDGPGLVYSTELDAIGLETLVATAKWCGLWMVGEYPYCRPILSGTAPSTPAEEEPDWGDWTWEDPNYEPDDGTDREPCVYDSPDHCVTRSLTEEEWNRLLAAIERIKETTPECAGAKQALRGLAAQGRGAERFRFWNGYDIRVDSKTREETQRFGENRSDAQGRYIEYDSHWVWEMPSLIVHEGLHLYLHQINAPLLGDENEAWVDAKAPTCV